ncbi:siphovirus Gp157 family protein [Rossellomorea vietnamensis]|uniref:Siphovirus Gp157 family protein n=1 Tax=Rossellomorea vietnamensis TaxID=218284 RepID=A0A5D4KH05_9BACI|nr:siphovirus Gp157 family protein [Rossellomorea vietnamensis]TYR75543.1 siphovirus Gp157 family protein [Rossellomorea vietnamensis]
MKLYELSNNYAALMEMAEEMDPTTLQDTLESIQEEIEDKAENIAKLIKNLNADVDALKAEEKRLADRRRGLEGKVSNLKEYLQNQLEVAGLDKVKRPTLTVSIQNNPPSVKVIDEKLLSDYMIPVDPKLDKKAILEALKDGREVNGAELMRTRGVRIR